jgi:hypothetical protein
MGTAKFKKDLHLMTSSYKQLLKMLERSKEGSHQGALRKDEQVLKNWNILWLG